MYCLSALHIEAINDESYGIMVLHNVSFFIAGSLCIFFKNNTMEPPDHLRSSALSETTSLLTGL